MESFKRDENGKLQRRNLEIDFVVNRHDERLYIQSAYALPDKEKVWRSYINDFNNEQK